MTVSELGSLGEFISSIAVLITLVFLVAQIRQSNRIAITNETTLRNNMRIQTQTEMAGSPYLIPALEKAASKYVANSDFWEKRASVCATYGLNEEEFMRLYWFYSQLFQWWEYSVLHPFKDDIGVVNGGIDWRFKTNMGGNLSQPLIREIWQLNRELFDRRFQAAMDDLIVEVDRASGTQPAG